jgi:hypothetical protein
MIVFGKLVKTEQMTGKHTAALMVINCIFCAWGQRANYVYQTARHMTIRLEIDDPVQFKHIGKDLRNCLPTGFTVKLKQPFMIIEFEEVL